MSASEIQAPASPSGSRMVRTVAVLLLGVGLGASGVLWLGRKPEAPDIALKPLRLATEEVLFPENARIIDSARTGEVVSWADPASDDTRCGQHAEATLLPSPLALPELSLCTVHNFNGGGSGDGCPLTTVCVARRGNMEMICTSDDESCRAIVKAFAP